MNLILTAIRLYQRFISPHKGFRCAYHAHTGRQSCSQLGFRAVRRYGARLGLAVLRQRLYLCGVAHRRYSAPHRRTPLHQSGFCDIGCDLPCDGNCDLPSANSCRFFGDLTSCCDCGSCDWSDRKGKTKQNEQHVYIPPKSDQNSLAAPLRIPVSDGHR